MLVSIPHKFLIVEVPKTGSSSIVSLLSRHVFSYTNKHATANNIRRLLGDNWKDYETYAVIRHPVEWLKSWYSFALKGELEGAPRSFSVKDLSFGDFVQLAAEESDIGNKIKTQSFYLVDPESSKLLIDNLFPFDHLEFALLILCQHYGIRAAEIPHLNSSGDHKKSIEVDAETSNLIEDHWKRDFTLYRNAYSAPVFNKLRELTQRG